MGITGAEDRTADRTAYLRGREWNSCAVYAEGKAITAAVGGRQTLKTKQMNKNNFRKLVDEDIRKAWLCRIGYHGEPLTKVEIAALNGIVRQTGMGKLVTRLYDLFDEVPSNPDEIKKQIDVIEMFGLRPGPNHNGFELQPDSPLDKEISRQVVAHKDLSRLVAHVNTPSFAATGKVAA